MNRKEKTLNDIHEYLVVHKDEMEFIDKMDSIELKETVINFSQLNNLKNITIGFLSDTHFAVAQKHNVFFHHLVNSVNEFISLCEQNNVDLVIHTGDVFDTKSEISTEGLINSNDLIDKIAAKYPLIIIPGNHDFAYKENNRLNLASNYKNHNNIVVVESYASFTIGDNIFHCLPFEVDPTKFLRKLKLQKGKKNILLGHFGVSGFKVHAYASTYANSLAAQVDPAELGKFTKVFLGHYHGYQTKNEITYVSAPLQSRHGDEKSKHGFVFWNTEKKDHVFVENKNTPRFITMDLTKANVQKLLELKGHYIRINVKKKVSKELLINLKRRILKKNHEVKFDYDLQDDIKLAVIEGWQDFVVKDPDSLIINFLDKLNEQKQLPYSKIELLKLLKINLK